MSGGWSRFPDPGGDHPGRVLWLLAEGEDARLAILDEYGDWHWDGGAKVGASGGPYPSLCHEVLPPGLPVGALDPHPEAAPGPLHVAPDRSGLGGHCLTLGPRGGAVASGMAKPDADLVAELWNDRLTRLSAAHGKPVPARRLDWQAEGEGPGMMFHADTPIGRYTAWATDGDGFMAAPGAPVTLRTGCDVATAKASAQADFERRIRSALVGG